MSELRMSYASSSLGKSKWSICICCTCNFWRSNFFVMGVQYSGQFQDGVSPAMWSAWTCVRKKSWTDDGQRLNDQTSTAIGVPAKIFPLLAPMLTS